MCFPGLAAEWAKWNVQRPFVGPLTLELPTDADDEVMSWIAAGTPPIFFGFGSMAVISPADTVAMISKACARLGERALVGRWTRLQRRPEFDNVKVVGTMNYATVFPVCRAVVHTGCGYHRRGAARWGPQLILRTFIDQALGDGSNG